MKKIAGIMFVSALAMGCATQRYGREQPVTDTEKRLLGCDQIELEIAKTEGFVRNTVVQDSKFTGRDVLGFLGDFGTGNTMEYSEAMQSGIARLTQLRDLQSARHCVSDHHIDSSLENEIRHFDKWQQTPYRSHYPNS